MTKTIEYNGKTIKMPFEVEDKYLTTEMIEVANHFSGETVQLPMFARYVRDTILGAEMVSNVTLMRKGLDWFQKHFAKEYMVLLD